MRIFIILSIVLFCNATLTAQEVDEKFKNKLFEYFELTGTKKTMKMSLEQMISTFQETMPEVPNEFWDEFSKEVDYDELLNLMLPIYSKYLTTEDLESITQFYKTPVGQKLLSNLPKVLEESYKAGEVWGERIGTQVIEKLKVKKYID